MLNDNDVVLKRLQWRSRRSMLEVDLYLDRFIRSGDLERLNSEELDCYADLLELNDWDFLALLQSQVLSGSSLTKSVIDKIIGAVVQIDEDLSSRGGDI